MELVQAIPDIRQDMLRLSAIDSKKDQLLSLIIDLFANFADKCDADQLALYDDVMVKLIACVEMEARLLAAQRISEIENAPKRITRCLAMEDMPVAEPILKYSKALNDEDLMMVMRNCGRDHMRAIAQREQVTERITDELMRRGDESVCELLSDNDGANFSNSGVSQLVRLARENMKIQHSMCERVDLPAAAVKSVVLEAGENIRSRLKEIGRRDLLVHLDQARAQASKRVLSTCSILGIEYDQAYRELLLDEKQSKITAQYLESALAGDDFPKAVCAFSRLADMDLDDAAHWLSRRDVNPAIVAFKACSLDRMVVETLLKSGPWKHILTSDVRKKSMQSFDALEVDVATRIFQTRRDGFAEQKSKRLN